MRHAMDWMATALSAMIIGIFIGGVYSMIGQVHAAHRPHHNNKLTIQDNQDFVYCHIIGRNNLDGLPESSKPLIRELIKKKKPGQKVHAKLVPLYLNGQVGLHIPPYTAFRIRPIPEPNWECFLMMNDSSY